MILNEDREQITTDMIVDDITDPNGGRTAFSPTRTKHRQSPISSAGRSSITKPTSAKKASLAEDT